MKHAGSGGSRGEVSPLAVQLQQAWLHTQTPKAKKRPVSSSQLTNSCIPPPPAAGAAAVCFRIALFPLSGACRAPPPEEEACALFLLPRG